MHLAYYTRLFLRREIYEIRYLYVTYMTYMVTNIYLNKLLYSPDYQMYKNLMKKQILIR